eukprot:4150059-Amphidinium_carterae.1
MRTKNFKTARVLGMQGEVLCLVAPALGVSHVKWAPAWKEALEKAGLFGRKEAPALPILRQGVSLGRPCTHAELGQAYR